MSYKKARMFVIGFLVLYLVFGLSLRAFKNLSTGQEIYPVFSWKLYSDVPQPDERIFKVRITSVDGEELSDPYFYLSSRLRALDKDTSTPRDNYIVTGLGEALSEGGSDKVLEFRKMLERPFGTSSVSYEVIELKSNGTTTENILGTFKSPVENDQ